MINFVYLSSVLDAGCMELGDSDDSRVLPTALVDDVAHEQLYVCF